MHRTKIHRQISLNNAKEGIELTEDHPQEYAYLRLPPHEDLRPCVGLVLAGMAARARVGVGGLEEAVEVLEGFHADDAPTRFRFSLAGDGVLAEVEEPATGGSTQTSRRYRRPDKARTRRLLVRYHKHGDQNARERVIQQQLPLAEFLARKFAGRGEPLDDLIQVASVGLIKAVDRFDVDRKIEFSTYATPNILGEIKRYFRDKGWAMRVPRGLQELRQSAKEAIRNETVRTGRSPTLQELAERLDADVEGVAEALTLGRAYNTASLDAPVSQDEPEGDTIMDFQADDESPIEGLEDRILLQEAIEGLKGQQQEILKLRFNEGKTQTEIADHIGVSQMHVSRLLRRALEDLRVELEYLEHERETSKLSPDGAHAE